MPHNEKGIIVKRVERVNDVKKIYVPRFMFDKTMEYLRGCGKRGSEGLLFWAGVRIVDFAFVTTCVFPRSFTPVISFHPFPPGHPSYSRTSFLPQPFVYVDLERSAKMVSEIRKRGLYLIAQIHSHPGFAFHSKIDETYAHAFFRGFMSIVVPNFGMSKIDSLLDCVLYKFEDKRFRRLTDGEVRNTFIILDSELYLV